MHVHTSTRLAHQPQAPERTDATSSLCSCAQTFITKFKQCVQMDQLSKKKRGVRVPLLHTAMLASFDPYDNTAYAAISNCKRSMTCSFSWHCG